MEIRLGNAGIGISDPGDLDPITGLRVLVVVDNDSGVRVLVPLTPSALELLHRQTSPIKMATLAQIAETNGKAS